MPFLLRSTKYSKWIAAKPDWVKEDEIPADPVFGLQTQNNTMSVWVVDNDSAHIERIIGALAATKTKQSLQNFEYVLLDSKIVADIGIKTLRTEGKSPDKELNKLHLDLVEISARKLLKLTETTLKKIWQKDINLVDRKLRKTVARYIFDSVHKGHINPTNLNSNILDQAQEVLGYSINEIP